MDIPQEGGGEGLAGSTSLGVGAAELSVPSSSVPEADSDSLDAVVGWRVPSTCSASCISTILYIFYLRWDVPLSSLYSA